MKLRYAFTIGLLSLSSVQAQSGVQRSKANYQESKAVTSSWLKNAYQLLQTGAVAGAIGYCLREFVNRNNRHPERELAHVSTNHSTRNEQNTAAGRALPLLFGLINQGGPSSETLSTLRPRSAQVQPPISLSMIEDSCQTIQIKSEEILTSTRQEFDILRQDAQLQENLKEAQDYISNLLQELTQRYPLLLRSASTTFDTVVLGESQRIRGSQTTSRHITIFHQVIDQGNDTINVYLKSVLKALVESYVPRLAVLQKEIAQALRCFKA
jgi:hypothetical protein